MSKESLEFLGALILLVRALLRWAVILWCLWAIFRVFKYGVIAVALWFEGWRRRRMRPPPDLLEQIYDEVLIYGNVVVVQGTVISGSVVYWPEQIKKMRLD